MRGKATIGILALFVAGAAAKVYREPIIIAPEPGYVNGLEAAIDLQSQGLAECSGFDGSTCGSITFVKWTGADSGTAVSSVLIDGNEVVLTYPVGRVNAAICSPTGEYEIRLAAAVSPSSLQADLERQNAVVDALQDEFSKRGKTICSAYRQTQSSTFQASTFEGWYAGPLRKASDIADETVIFGPVSKFRLRDASHSDQQTLSAAMDSKSEGREESWSVIGPKDQITQGLCQMGECPWSRILNVQAVRKSGGSELRKVALLGGSATDAGDAQSKLADVEWNSEPHSLYVLCSRKLPTVALKDSGEWQVDVLDFSMVSGAQTGAAELYVQICHGLKADAWADEGFMSRYGYRAGGPYSPSNDSMLQLSINSPEELFRYDR
jgi:hypothetical protein